MPSSTPPSCISGSGVTLICQEAEGGQIYNDSREQHQVTAVNIYTGLTKDVAEVCGGSKHCRNYNQPQIINHIKITRWREKAGFLTALSWLRQQRVMFLWKHPAVCACTCEMNGALIMIHDITVSRQPDTVAAIYGFRNTCLAHHFLPLTQLHLAHWVLLAWRF